MKKYVWLVMAFLLVGSCALAEEAATQTTATAEVPAIAPAETVTVTGEIIDNMCAGAQTAEALPAFVQTHTKECAAMPNCAASGYSIYADGKLTKFDAASNAKVEEFLKKPESSLKVKVTANKVGGELALVSIENQ